VNITNLNKISDEDLLWMSVAFEEAEKSLEKNEVPVGAIITRDNRILSRGHNLPISRSDPTSHAEINAIRSASKKTRNYRLANSTLYVTLEPCVMCYGAIIHSRIARVVFGAYDSVTGSCGSCLNLSKAKCFNHYPEIIGGVMQKKCAQILTEFFKERRN